MRAIIVNPSPNTQVGYHADRLVSGATDLGIRAIPLLAVLAVIYVAKSQIPALGAFISGNLQARTPTNVGPTVGASGADITSLLQAEGSNTNTIVDAIKQLQQSVGTTVGTVTGTGTGGGVTASDMRAFLKSIDNGGGSGWWGSGTFSQWVDAQPDGVIIAEYKAYKGIA